MSVSSLTLVDEEGNPFPPGVLVSIAASGSSTALVAGFVGIGGVVPLSAALDDGTYDATFLGGQAPSGTLTFTLNTSDDADPIFSLSGYLSPTMAPAGYVASEIEVYPILRGSAAALAPGGVTYAILNQEGAARAALDTQNQFAQSLMRLQTSPGLLIGGVSAVDLWAQDFLGIDFPRAPGESEAAYIVRLFARLAVPLTTIAALQLMVDFFLEAFTSAAALQTSIALGEAGGLGFVGALDGLANFQAQLPSVTVFDAQTNPALALAVGIAPPQFCILFGSSTPVAYPTWYLGDPTQSFLGVNTYLGRTPAYTTVPAPSAQLDALIRSVKAGGTQPIYVISSSS